MISRDHFLHSARDDAVALIRTNRARTQKSRSARVDGSSSSPFRLRRERNAIADALGVDLSPRIRDGPDDGDRTATNGTARRRRRRDDDFESYQSLVKESGR